MTGYIRELFTSVQGEGIKLGKRQTFIRFLGCNLSCNYCDTPDTQKKEGPFVYAGKILPNPVTVDLLLDKLDADEISITGGEPLLQMEFLVELCERMIGLDKEIYLDTNGTLPDELSKIIKYIDTVSLDFKIPTATGRPKLWNEHASCLEIAAQKAVYVKMVINDNLLPQELDTACNIIKKVDKNIILVLQPISGSVIPNILDIQKTALRILKDVRIIPQVHTYLGLA
ncbi:MAG: 7-carboxy-7-deazaguanine synthase QueE [bacterium]